MRLDKSYFEEHVNSPLFRDGVARGYWDLAPRDGVDWPYAVIWLSVPRKLNGPDRFFLYFHLQDYPSKGPTAYLLDPEKNQQLDSQKWPKGTGDVKSIFRKVWADIDCLYAPWDRLAFEKHSDWGAKYGGTIWDPSRTIVHYLRLTREALDTDEYHGT